MMKGPVAQAVQEAGAGDEGVRGAPAAHQWEERPRGWRLLGQEAGQGAQQPAHTHRQGSGTTF